MGRKEVERWDPPNAVTPKLPFPMWGATSKYVKQNDLAGPVFPVERKNDAATMTPKAEVPETQKSVSYPVFAIEKSAHEYKCDEIADIKLPKLFVGPVLVMKVRVVMFHQNHWLQTNPKSMPLYSRALNQLVRSLQCCHQKLNPKF